MKMLADMRIGHDPVKMKRMPDRSPPLSHLHSTISGAAKVILDITSADEVIPTLKV